MKSFSQIYEKHQTLKEEETQACVFTFGRFQPPTRGHRLVFLNMMKLAHDVHGPMFIFPSQTHDQENNPLDWNTKVSFLRRLFPKIAGRIIQDQDLRTVFDVAEHLYKRGYRRITMVVGSDKVDQFKSVLENYNGKKSSNSDKFYQFDQINVVQAGDERVEGEMSLRGASGTDARRAARAGNYDEFLEIMPKTDEKLIKEIFMAIRKAYGLGEVRKEHTLSRTNEREEFFSGKLLNEGDTVLHNGQEAIIKSLGCNFARLQIGKEIKKVWISDIEKE